MKKPIIIIISLLYSCFLIAQEINIRGHVYDYNTDKRISGVVFSCVPGEILDISSTSGSFHLRLNLDSNKTVRLFHPDYHTKFIELKNSDKLKFQSYYMINRKYEIDTVFNISNEKNKLLTAIVIDGNSFKPLKDAVAKIPEGQKIGYSNINGEIFCVIPKSTSYINISSLDFESTIVKLKPNKKRESFSIKLKKINLSQEDTLWKSYKHLIEITPNELISGSVGIRYHHFIKNRHSIGLQTSYYFNGKLYAFMVSDSKFTGFKLAPIYRYYVNRNMKNQVFIETKVIVGYFDFYDLYYGSKADNRRGAHFSEKVWTYGFACGMGYTFVLHKTRNIIMGGSASFQYLPANVPREQWSDNYGKVYVENYFWSIGGPGSVIEIKIIVGGIF